MKKVTLVPYVESFEKSFYFKGESLIRSEKILKKSQRGKGVVISVIDTGVDINHPLLKENILDGFNFTSENNGDPSMYLDSHGHGTHVAGTIIKVAPKIKLLILKALNNKGIGSYSDVTKAIKFSNTWKGERGEKVSIICLSLGGEEYDKDLHLAIKNAIKKNISIVVAAGNYGDGDSSTNEINYPGNFNEVIQVGAINQYKEIAHFSNSNNEIDLVAPGVNIYSSFINNSYSILSGTSMAAPHVAACLALLKNITSVEFGRPLTEAELYAQLIKRTYSLSHPKNKEGNGLINLDLIDDLRPCANITDF